MQLPLYFCSASDGTNVVNVFTGALAAALEFKSRPSSDFIDDVLETVAYFKQKEKNQTEEDKTTAEAAGNGEKELDSVPS